MDGWGWKSLGNNLVLVHSPAILRAKCWLFSQKSTDGAHEGMTTGWGQRRGQFKLNELQKYEIKGKKERTFLRYFTAVLVDII